MLRDNVENSRSPGVQVDESPQPDAGISSSGFYLKVGFVNDALPVADLLIDK